MSLSTSDVRIVPLPQAQDVLTEVLRCGAQKLLAEAVEAEVADWIEQHHSCLDEHGRRQVVRNGHLPARTLTTGVGPVAVQQPRVHDRRPADLREKFASALLPPYLRKTKSVEELIPWLYLKGVSTGDFSEALAALLGPDAKGLSATTVTRLKGLWEKEYQDWSRRSLAGKQYVYVWADGVYFNIRLEGGRQCILVLLGATADGKKELLAIQDGQRESEQSWKELLLDVQARGLTLDPKLAIGDGALGFWKAVRQVWPEVREQRCWVHKTANVLDKLPKSVQPKAKEMLHEIYLAPSRAEADKAFDLFVRTYEAKYPKATECLAKDRKELLTFYDFPAEHWLHLRTTNAVESVFATVRLRTDKTKGTGTRVACLTMVFKLMESASRRWRALNGSALLAAVIGGVVFVDGIKQEDAA
ncbi:MAG: IS256 family transposase [Gemmataceae bacterium]|nr:IS256 family transposase [Gemmataceae bacterium]